MVDQQDFSIRGRIPIDWIRHYGSRNERRGLCGCGWETPADARLVFELDNTVMFYDGSSAPTLFPSVPLRHPVMDIVDGARLEGGDDFFVVRTKAGVGYYLRRVTESRDEIPISHIEDAWGNSLRFIRDQNGLRRIDESAGRIIEVSSVNGLIQRMDLRSVHADDVSPLVRFEYDAVR